MSQAMVLDIMRDAFFTIMIVSAPVLIVSMLIGLIISIIQATTQIQDQTLTFVPKLIAVFLSLIFFGNFMLNTLIAFFNRTMVNLTNVLR
ncbi:flagellar biosynthesis protein FliQ [Clostridium grantii]|uniref:Flagellar biosynthetic protein FliQ n=1 Tax=Clostridium grantii DSM 8605 TaxID=1121316 RepID=A0A1M5XKL1_9CLOT|nr:flagellar biosynthesis protein FliQ [Clostridium grantii]SHH99783.1 flagellar biosynthetic protein FliQ [Clostridium grantii DSM 8605]